MMQYDVKGFETMHVLPYLLHLAVISVLPQSATRLQGFQSEIMFPLILLPFVLPGQQESWFLVSFFFYNTNGKKWNVSKIGAYVCGER